jgi:hypothetical protein
MADPVVEGTQEEEEFQPDAEGKLPADKLPVKDGKYPSVVPWTKYVGLKEKFTRVEGELKTKVSSLEEQLKTAANPEELKKISGELEKTKGELEKQAGEFAKIKTELDTLKGKTVADKKASLIKLGVPEAEVNGLDEKGMDSVLKVLATTKTKPKSDFGSGGGGSVPTGSPIELARAAYADSK